MSKKKKKEPPKPRKRTRQNPLNGKEFSDSFNKDIRSVVDGLTKAFRPTLTIMSYDSMKRLCNGFIDTLHALHTNDYTPIQKEMVQTAGKEILTLLREKYEIPAGDAAILLLTIGMSTLEVTDQEYEIKKRQTDDV